MVEWMSYPLYYAFDGAAPPPRAGAAHATIYPYGPFPAGDGKTVMLGLQNEREWTAFCEKVLEQPELAPTRASPPIRGGRACAQELRAIIVEVFSQLTAEQVIARLDAAQIANARMNDMHDVWEHAQLRARDAGSRSRRRPGRSPALLPPGLAEWVRAAHGRRARARRAHRGSAAGARLRPRRDCPLA